MSVHNNGPDEEAIISAHWHGEPVGCGHHMALSSISFDILNDNDDWEV